VVNVLFYTHLVTTAVADHDEEGAVVRLYPIGDEGRDTVVELFPHGGGMVVDGDKS
jgi:hypothetical protein